MTAADLAQAESDRNQSSNGLPEGWTAVKFGEIVSPSKEKIEPDQCPNSPYLSLEHVKSHGGTIVGHGQAREVRSTKAVFRAGDVIYGKLRPYLNKVAIPQFDGVCSTDFLVFRRNDCLDNQLLLWFLLRPGVVRFANHHSTGVQLPRVNFEALAELEFPLPPLDEQKRIVEKVEKLLVHVKAARERLGRVPGILTRFRRVVLAAACSGRLTADWRDLHSVTESAARLLERLQVERRERWHVANGKRKYREPEPVLDEELPPIPETWCWTNFDHCSWEITVGHVGPMSDQYVKSGVPFLRSQNVRPLRFDVTGLVQISPRFHAQLSKSKLLGGELLIVRSGANTGDCCVFPSLTSGANCADLVITRPLSGLSAEYAALYVNSPDGQARLSLRQTGIAQPHFNIGAMRVKAFAFPPLVEQHEIVRRVEALFKLADAIEERVAATTARADKLTRAILAKAFRGELVPTEAELARREGRAYESASDLLARIRSERPVLVERAVVRLKNGKRQSRASAKAHSMPGQSGS